MSHFNLMWKRYVRTAPLLVGLFLATSVWTAQADTTDLADVPLANAPTATILPNIMVDLDSSGSMQWDYMPDYVRFESSQVYDKWCRGTDSNNTLLVCEQGDPPYFASGFNGMYYNPSVTYTWPRSSDGSLKADWNGTTSYASSTTWTTIPSDGYKVLKIDNNSTSDPSTACTTNALGSATCDYYSKSATIDLTTAYPERVWCKNSTDTPPSANCVSAIDGSNNYSYPNGTYKYMKVQLGAPYYYNVSVEWCKQRNTTGSDKNYGKSGTCQSKKDSTYQYVHFYNWSRVNITAATVFPTKATTRTDCAGTTCTYAEEMANFATWYAWYRTRIQMTKSAVGLAFNDVRGTPKTGADLIADPTDSNYFHARVGLATIDSSTITMNIANFDSSQKSSFYSNLYGINPTGGTPLRTSLDEMGKMYKGTSSVFTSPVQYSCQKNFTILTTDGYWNDSYSGVGDVDGVTGVSKPSYDGSKTANTLADVAYYYYNTDLHPGTCSSPDICTNNVPSSGTNAAIDDTAQWQHMTTFTVGLGVSGTLTYQSDYKTSTSGDYYNILQGTTNWPAPSSNSQTTVDDLWHAAVDGHGSYLSAQDPQTLVDGLTNIMNNLQSTTGSGAAAATSNLQPTAGNNAIYIATYRTVLWDGEMTAYTVDISTGAISSTSTWTASSQLATKIASTGDSDTRTIYTANGTTRELFTSAGMTAGQLAYFDNTKLSQYANWSASDKTAATSSLLVNYLRGQDRYEDQDRSGTYGTYNRLYRDRSKILGDIIHAQPIFVQAPNNHFSDTGYSTFITAQSSRASVVYAASNDGMLHAFNASTGAENWAYVPPAVLPNMWKLADSNYSSNHRYFLDGPLVSNDAYINGAWKTVLIGAMGHGGRGYYALDITDPTNPQPLWNYTADNNPNMGYSYGTPFITKLSDGTWVAVLTSGYNNIPEGGNYATADGGGYVFVLKLADGTLLKTISTGVGSTTSPSGLGKLNILVDNFDVDNTALAAYGGDLYGNMWKFDLNAGTAAKIVAFGSTKPIEVAPEIAYLNGKKVIYFGTGRYLGTSDLTDTSVQSIYAVLDDGSAALTDTSTLVQKTLTTSGSNRTITASTVDWSTKHGWYFDLPDTGERVSTDLQLYFGTLVVASVVPTATDCQPGGYSWLYQLDYSSGGMVSGATTAGLKYTSPIVGLTVVKLATGTPIVYPITADGQKPAPDVLNIPASSTGGGVRRVLWRELPD